MKVFIVTPIDVWCPNFVKFGQREIGEIVRCLPDQNKSKISAGSQAVAAARIAPKIYQGQPLAMYSIRVLPISNQIGSLSAEL